MERAADFIFLILWGSQRGVHCILKLISSLLCRAFVYRAIFNAPSTYAVRVQVESDTVPLRNVLVRVVAQGFKGSLAFGCAAPCGPTEGAGYLGEGFLT